MDTFQGMPGLQSFSPGWGNPELLEKTLVSRKELVDRLEELVIDGAGGPNKHQRLIVGVRGSGKTHVLRVLHNRLWANEELKKRLMIIYLLEDEMGVASFLDFVVRMLRSIVRWYPERKELADELKAIYDLPSVLQESHAIQLLLNTTGSKDVLIIMENLGVTFDKVKGFGEKGQSKLRDLIQENPRFMIFASSQALVEGARDQDRPFYEFFKVIHLRRLTLEEAMAFLTSIAAATDKQDAVRFLKTPKGRARMRAIYEFTGGNHRLLVTFYEFLTTDSLAKLSGIFVRALNPLKPYYQEQMRNLSAQQQKIVQYLSLERTPCPVKDIARGCLAASNTISRQLKDLLEKNFVSKFDQGRESCYEVMEALFRICYEADLEQEGAPIRLFVDFLANLYTAQELSIRHRGYDLLAHRLGNKGSVPFADEAELYRKGISIYHPDVAMKLSKQESAEFKESDRIHTFFKEMEEFKAYREIVEFSRHLGEERDAFVLHAEASAYAHLGDTEKARDAAQKAIEKDPNDVEAHIVLANVLARQQETTEDALKHARLARELSPKDPKPLACIGIALGMAGNHGEALRTFELLRQEHTSYAEGWLLAGVALESLERVEEAEAAYRKTLELDAQNRTALERLGILVGSTGGHEEALDLFQRLTEASANYAMGWVLAGRVLYHLKRGEEAEAAYRKALELEAQNNKALELLGILVNNDERYEEALDIFQRLNGVAPEDVKGWALTGRVLENLERVEEAEAAYRKTLELDAKNRTALERLGILVGSTGGHEEALDLFQKLNEVAPEDTNGWTLTGRALESLKRGEEAEAAYRKALELNPRETNVLEWLGILVGSTGGHEEALDLFQKLNEVAPEDTNGWTLTGRALESLKRGEEAEAAYRKALELNPRETNVLELLGILVDNKGSHKEALGLFQRLTEASADYAKGWALTGQALLKLERTEEAEAAYRKALELDPSEVSVLLGLGIIFYVGGRHEEALRMFKKLTEEFTDHAVGWALMGHVLQKLKRGEEAEVAYHKALELGPRDPVALVLIGSFLDEIGRHAEALELSEKLSEIAPDFVYTWVLSGSALRNLGRRKEAEAVYRKALELDPRDALAMEWLARLVSYRGQHEEALELFERVNKIAPDDSYGWKGTARELEYLGREEEASEMFEKAVSLGADRVLMLNSRGEVRRKLGKYQKAIADYEEALKADPKVLWPYFNIVSALLAMGNIEGALEALPKAIDAIGVSEEGDDALIAQSFQENCEALFEGAPVISFATYLERALDIIEKGGYLDKFKESVPITVFAVLKKHKSLEKERLMSVVRTFEDVIGRRMEVDVAVCFLQVGIDYFKKKSRRALLRLTREERRTFCKELGIEDPGGES